MMTQTTTIEFVGGCMDGEHLPVEGYRDRPFVCAVDPAMEVEQALATEFGDPPVTARRLPHHVYKLVQIWEPMFGYRWVYLFQTTHLPKERP